MIWPTTTILAIDDDPSRYIHFKNLLEAGNVKIVVVCCAKCVARELPKAVAVLLDYDLDSGAGCAGCGNQPERASTMFHVPAMIEAALPVIVTSASHSINRARLVTALRDGGINAVQISAIEVDPELRWLGWLWTKHVL